MHTEFLYCYNENIIFIYITQVTKILSEVEHVK